MTISSFSYWQNITEQQLQELVPNSHEIINLHVDLTNAIYDDDFQFFSMILSHPIIHQYYDKFRETLAINDYFSIIANRGTIQFFDYMIHHPISDYQMVLKDNDTIFETCIQRNEVALYEYLLKLDPTLIHFKEDFAIFHSCISNALDCVQFLLKSHQLKEHANIHTLNDSSFNFIAYRIFTSKEHDYKQLIDYLIFDYNIPFTHNIQQFFMKKESENSSSLNYVKTLFEKRDLHVNLQKDLILDNYFHHQNKVKKL